MTRAADPAARLYVPADTVVHRLPAQPKVVAVVLFVLCVVLTPPTAGWAFAWYAVLLVGVAAAAGLPPGTIRRLAVEVPFLAFAVLLPFVGRPPTIEVLGMSLSQPGLLAAWNIVAKATLGVAASVVLAATTRPTDLLDGLAALRVPPLLVEIGLFMLRYLQVVSMEWSRMAQARAARGWQAAGPRSWPVVARSAGVLFVRSYERGERVHLAMRARGYEGRMPVLGQPLAGRRDWLAALALPAGASVATIAAVLA